MCNEKDGLGKKSEDHNNFYISALARHRPTLRTLSATRCSTMTFAQLAVVRTCRATLEVAEWDITKKTIFEIWRVGELFSYQ